MKLYIFNFLVMMILPAQVIFDFNKNADTSKWKIIDDVVMGGKSSGNFYINGSGNGVFEGEVSLENNGGFSSLRLRFDKVSTEGFTKIVVKVKGDGKKYQFRIKTKTSDYYSYISYFESKQEWTDIEIPLKTMSPAFRGRKLDIPNYDADFIEEIAFLIGNKKEERFKLEINKIMLK